MKNTIVKVQLSIASSDGFRYIMIYDKEESFTLQTEATDDWIKLMNGEDKKFFYADVVNIPKNIELDVKIKDEAPWQDW